MIQNQTSLNLEISEPKLAPPGAGIPWYQKLFLRYYVRPFVAAKTPIEVSVNRFQRVNEKILAEIDGLTDSQLRIKILVPPQRGLEDSSRYWSISMVLEHMVIVGKGIEMGLQELSNGRVPTNKADIGKLKPFGQMSPSESLQHFKTFCNETYPKMTEMVLNNKYSLKYLHPWFGNFNAQQWHWIVPTHHQLHLKQIREIKKRLDYV